MQTETTETNPTTSQPADRRTTPESETAWQAVLNRDTGFDGRFVFAVSSTGIYCRPSCPARRARRENVTFFPTPSLAERAGFRACRRCRPESDRPSAAARRVELAVEYLDEHLDEKVTLDELGRAVGMSPTHLQRTFKRTLGVSPKEYVRARRLEILKSRLQQGDGVLDATFEAGYGASSRVYDPSTAPLGMTPATYRRGGRGMHIRFVTVASPLGRLLVGATERGISAVTLGESDAELEKALREEYPNASLERSEAGLLEWVRAIVRHLNGEHLNGEPGTLDLPLDVRATAFQWRVWKALRDIPRSATRSYGEIARTIGAPGASRAVARACATNPVALLVPCHRVVRKDGAAGGYRWGGERKRRLLEMERSLAE